MQIHNFVLERAISLKLSVHRKNRGLKRSSQNSANLTDNNYIIAASAELFNKILHSHIYTYFHAFNASIRIRREGKGRKETKA